MTAVIDMSEDKPLLYHGESDFNFPSGSNCGYQGKTSAFTRRRVVPNLFDCRSSGENILKILHAAFFHAVNWLT